MRKYTTNPKLLESWSTCISVLCTAIKKLSKPLSSYTTSNNFTTSNNNRSCSSNNSSNKIIVYRVLNEAYASLSKTFFQKQHYIQNNNHSNSDTSIINASTISQDNINTIEQSRTSDIVDDHIMHSSGTWFYNTIVMNVFNLML